MPAMILRLLIKPKLAEGNGEHTSQHPHQPVFQNFQYLFVFKSFMLLHCLEYSRVLFFCSEFSLADKIKL